MRRLLLASCVVLLPGLALAQSTTNPPASPQGSDETAPWQSPGPGMMGGGWGGPGMMGGGWGKDRRGFGPDDVLVSFYAANTTHDGHLTLAQAKAAGFTPEVDNFDAMSPSMTSWPGAWTTWPCAWSSGRTNCAPRTEPRGGAGVRRCTPVSG